MTEFDLRSLLAVPHENGVPVQICSLARLRAMKQARDREQDRADLANLPDE